MHCKPAWALESCSIAENAHSTLTALMWLPRNPQSPLGVFKVLNTGCEGKDGDMPPKPSGIGVHSSDCFLTASSEATIALATSGE